MDEYSFGSLPVQSLPSCSSSHPNDGVDCSPEDLGFTGETDSLASCKLESLEFVLDGETIDSLEKLGFITSPGMDEIHEVKKFIAGGSSSSLVELDMAGGYDSKTNLTRNSRVSTDNQGSFLDWKNPWGVGQYGVMGSVQTPVIETPCDVMTSNSLSCSIRLSAHTGHDSSDQSSTEVELAGIKDHEVGSASVSQIAIPNLYYAPSWEPLDYSQVQFQNDVCRFHIPSSPSNSIMSTAYLANQVRLAWDSGVLASHGNQNCAQVNGRMSSNGDIVAGSSLLQNHQDREAKCTFLGCRGSCLMPQRRTPFTSNKWEEPYYGIMGQNHPNSPYEELNLLQQTPLLPEQMPTIPIFSKFQDTGIYGEFQIAEIVYRVTRQDGALLTASYNKNGRSFAIKKLIETIKRSSELVRKVMSVLGPESLNLMQSKWGSYVIKHCILNFTNNHNHIMVENCVLLSENRWGYLIVKECICSMGNPYKNNLLNKIADKAIRLSQHSLGNFVIQDVLDSHVPNIVQRICCHELKGKYACLSMKRFSSHVVEKCIQSSQTETVIEELMISNNLHNLICNPFGNYVIQTALRIAKDDLHDRLVETIRAILAQNRSLQHNHFASHVFKVIQNEIK
ncbi:hypothetical protein ACLOJK_035731 [Asimina triloba]